MGWMPMARSESMKTDLSRIVETGQGIEGMNPDPAVTIFIEFLEQFVGAFGEFANTRFEVAGEVKVDLDIVVYFFQQFPGGGAEGISFLGGEVQPRMKARSQQVQGGQQYDREDGPADQQWGCDRTVVPAPSRQGAGWSGKGREK